MTAPLVAKSPMDLWIESHRNLLRALDIKDSVKEADLQETVEVLMAKEPEAHRYIELLSPLHPMRTVPPPPKGSELKVCLIALGIQKLHKENRLSDLSKIGKVREWTELITEASPEKPSSNLERALEKIFFRLPDRIDITDPSVVKYARLVYGSILTLLLGKWALELPPLLKADAQDISMSATLAAGPAPVRAQNIRAQTFGVFDSEIEPILKHNLSKKLGLDPDDCWKLLLAVPYVSLIDGQEPALIGVSFDKIKTDPQYGFSTFVDSASQDLIMFHGSANAVSMGDFVKAKKEGKLFNLHRETGDRQYLRGAGVYFGNMCLAMAYSGIPEKEPQGGLLGVKIVIPAEANIGWEKNPSVSQSVVKKFQELYKAIAQFRGRHHGLKDHQIANQSSLAFFRDARAPFGGIEGIASPFYQIDSPAFIAFAETHHRNILRTESYLIPFKILLPRDRKNPWVDKEGNKLNVVVGTGKDARYDITKLDRIDWKEEDLPLPPSLEAFLGGGAGFGVVAAGPVGPVALPRVAQAPVVPQPVRRAPQVAGDHIKICLERSSLPTEAELNEALDADEALYKRLHPGEREDFKTKIFKKVYELRDKTAGDPAEGNLHYGAQTFYNNNYSQPLLDENTLKARRLAAIEAVMEDLIPAPAGAGGPGLAQAAPTLDIFETTLKDDASLLALHTGNIHLVDKHGFNSMMVSAMHRCPNALEWCIRNGVGRTHINKEERTEGLTPLMFSCIAWSSHPTKNLDNPQCARMLLEAGADPEKKNVKGDTALHWAVNSDFIEIVRFLSFLKDFPNLVDIKNGTKEAPGQTPLQVAEAKGKFAIAAVIREAKAKRAEKADVFTHLDIDKAKFGCDVKSLEPKIKLKKRGGATSPPAEGGAPEPLIQATIGDYLCSSARRGEEDVLTRFRTYIDSVDSDGRNILMSACVARQLKIIDWYLKAVPEGRRTQLFAGDDYSCSPVHFAAAGGKAEDQGDPACMQAVAEAGCDINALDNAGCTPLHLAAQNGFEKIVDYLLSRPECHPGTLDFFGRNAAYYARINKYEGIAKKIEDAIKSYVPVRNTTRGQIDRELAALLEEMPLEEVLASLKALRKK